MTLILAILILAALSLAVWAGLEFYKRRTGQRTSPPGTGNFEMAIAANSLDRSKMIRVVGRIKEAEHDFTV